MKSQPYNNMIVLIWKLAVEIDELKFQNVMFNSYQRFTRKGGEEVIQAACKTLNIRSNAEDAILSKNVGVLYGDEFVDVVAVFSLLKKIRDRSKVEALSDARHSSGFEPSKQLTNEKK